MCINLFKQIKGSFFNLGLTILVIMSSQYTLAQLEPNTNVYAVGGDGSGGGSAQCSEYSDLALMVTSTLMQIGQDKIDAVMRIINANELFNIKQGLKCIPVSSLNRPAYSTNFNNGKSETKLRIDSLPDSWGQLKINQRVRLVAHELAVLARYENDGEYGISSYMIKILEFHSEYFKDAERAARTERIIRNGEVVTLIRPMDIKGHLYATSYNSHIYNDAEFKLARAICLNFGFKELVSKSFKWNSENTSDKKNIYGILDDSGNYLGVQDFKDKYSNAYVIDVVNCK